MGATPGKAYQPSGWEIWAPLRPLFEAGEYEQVADRTRELLADHPGYPILYYNLACAESLAGRKADALEHLRLAIEGWEDSRSYAAGIPTSTRSGRSPASWSSWASRPRRRPRVRERAGR
jgi:tetratricopeptide (TPR) repeat protein